MKGRKSGCRKREEGKGEECSRLRGLGVEIAESVAHSGKPEYTWCVCLAKKGKARDEGLAGTRVMSKSLEYGAEHLELCFEVYVIINVYKVLTRGVTSTLRKVTLAFGKWVVTGTSGDRNAAAQLLQQQRLAM